MLVSLSDSQDGSVCGVWYNPDPIDIALAIAGTPFVLLVDDTSSHAADDLYDLTPPPSFLGPVMIWGRVEDDGVLSLFLADRAGDSSFPFASLAGFRNALAGHDAPVGAGMLHRARRLPPDISWSLMP